MIKYYTLLATCCAFSYSIAQMPSTNRINVRPAKTSMIDRYQIDYELKDYAFTGDSSFLEQINIEILEHMRLETEQVKAYDPDNEVVIILYSKAHARKAKENLGSN